MKMRDYVIRRMLLTIPVLFGATILIFTISHSFGDPAAAWITEKTRDDVRQMIIDKHGLDKPIIEQYFYYLRDVAHGDFGVTPLEGGRPVIDVILDYFPLTLELTLISFVILLALGLPLGIISAVKKNTFPDHLSRFFALAGVSIPLFWFALMLQFIFFFQLAQIHLPHLPLEGRYTPVLGPPARVSGLYLLDSLLLLDTERFFDTASHLVLPSLTMAFSGVGIITRIMRSSMLEVVRQDYIRTARSKGLPERVVIYKHALRNAMIPTVTLSGLMFSGALGGAPLVELVFNLPGLGRYTAAAMLTTDFGGIMGTSIFFALIIIIANLCVDIIYSVIDPRVRLS